MAVLTWISIVAINGVPFAGGYKVRALVPAGAPLLKDGDDVRIAGRRAGQVKKVSYSQGGALVSMNLDKGPIGPGARAVVRLRGLAGAVYVELHRGDTSHPLDEDALIPRSATSAGTQLTDVVEGFHADTRAALSKTLSGYGIGLAGNGDELNHALAVLPETLQRHDAADARALAGARRAVGHAGRAAPHDARLRGPGGRERPGRAAAVGRGDAVGAGAAPRRAAARDGGAAARPGGPAGGVGAAGPRAAGAGDGGRAPSDPGRPGAGGGAARREPPGVDAARSCRSWSASPARPTRSCARAARWCASCGRRWRRWRRWATRSTRWRSGSPATRAS